MTEPDGLQCSVDAIAAIGGNEYQAEGWAVLRTELRAPDHLLIASPVSPGNFIVQSIHPFSRLERPDVAAHFRDDRLTFTGWNVRYSTSPAPRDERVLLAHDACRNLFFRLASISLPHPAPPLDPR